ncbi:MAG: DnaA/Hda family protein [Dehalococcoidia bacterium]
MPEHPIGSARELAQAWRAVLGRLELELSPHNYATWLKGTRALRMDGDAMVVEAAHSFGCDWLNHDLMPTIQRVATGALGEGTTIHFVPPGFVEREQAAAPAAAQQVIGKLKCDLRFDTYLAASANTMALSACRMLVEGGGPAISPIVIHGRPGMGKTHLLNATAAAAAALGWRVAYLTGEQFTNRFLGAMKGGGLDEFKESLRTIRLLCLDDLQYLVGKKATADELTHTMEALNQSGGHVVVASEDDPRDLALPERLVSRLAGGLVTDVRPFAIEERRRYLEQTLAIFRMCLPDWASERIVATEAPSVRAIQGAIHSAIQLVRAGGLTPERLDLELVRHTACSVGGKVDAGAIIGAVARHFAVSDGDVLGTSRVGGVREARAVAAFALNKRGMSLAQVGRAIRRSKGTAGELVTRGKSLAEQDITLRQIVAA